MAQNQNRDRRLKSVGTEPEEAMSDRTQGWEAQTLAASEKPKTLPQRSRTALAYQSATALSRLKGAARREALERHFEKFPPAIGSHRSCPPRRS